MSPNLAFSANTPTALTSVLSTASDPDECIDCAVCIPECPTNAIMAEEDVPEDQQEFIALNAELARVWPSITRMKPHTDEAEEWRDVLVKRQYLKKELE